MNARGSLVVTLVLCLLADGFCRPYRILRKRDTENNELETFSETPATTAVQNTSSSEKPEVNNDLPPPIPYNDDDDDDDFENMATSSSGDNDGGGSNIFSLLRIAGAILPSSSNQSVLLRNIIRQLIKLNQPKPKILRRQFFKDNEIEVDFSPDIKPPPSQNQEENSNESASNSIDESNESDNAAEESVEEPNEKDSKENSASDNASVDDDSDYDSDEPPGGGDGQGGGILGLLAGLSGGEDGQSDLGSLLATVSGIVANLSGDGIDLNALIASGIGLFVGLLSEGEENPGAVIASYLLTSLDTITGGGSKNNGAFFGTFLSKLVKGTSATGDEESSEESGNKMKMSDSAGFFISLIMSLLGDMSKGSSGGSHPW